MNNNWLPEKENLTKDNADICEWHFIDQSLNLIHLCRRLHKNKSIIEIYPFGYSRNRGLSLKKIKTITLEGWEIFEKIPRKLKSGNTINLNSSHLKPLSNFLYKKFPTVESLKITRLGKTRFSSKTITFNWNDLNETLLNISKETETYKERKQTALQNSLAKITSKITARKTKLDKDEIAHYLSFYDDPTISEDDANAILALVSAAPTTISVTQNYLETKDKINIAYLEDVIKKFETLLKATNENEKQWQDFFANHGWILANLFPFQVILFDKEAYVGGKTIHNSEGRLVDFLFQNGFKDNYALLEIKTHNTELLKSKAYRLPNAFSLHESFSGAISQCLDQKNTFLTNLGKEYSVLDPRVILLIGLKSKLSKAQSACFELCRSNLKNIEIVTFDELLDKVKGLRKILKGGK